jgi:hypothetical protein
VIDVPGGGTFTAPGGLLTSEITNIGRYDDSAFVFIPEFRLSLGARVTQSLSLRAGYNLIIWVMWRALPRICRPVCRLIRERRS